MKKLFVAVILLMVVGVTLLPTAKVLADGVSATGTGTTSTGKIPPNFTPNGGAGTSSSSTGGGTQKTTPNTGGGAQVKPKMPIQAIQAIKPRVPIKPRP